MHRLAVMILAAVAVELVTPATSQAAPDITNRAGAVNASAGFTTLGPRMPAPGASNGPALPVRTGLVCWYDAAVGVTTNVHGIVQSWADLSGNDHFATRTAGAPVVVPNQLNAKPAVQFRTDSGPCGFNVDGPFFVEQQYIVVRSPNAQWNKDGCFLGRRSKRSSSYRLGRNSTAFWNDQYPAAVARNGVELRGQPFDLGTITEYMILRINVNDGDMSKNSYQIGMGDSASCDHDIAEILGYQTVLSPADEELVGGYLAAKYGIATTYPVCTGMTSACTLANTPADNVLTFRPGGTAVGSLPPTLPVKKGLVCWYDAAVGITADAQGAIQTWNDLSGHAHHATPGSSAAPLVVPNQLNAKPVVQFRKNWMALAGTFFAKEHYLVLRSPSPQWNGASGLLGRLKGRGSSYNTYGQDTGFWSDQAPAAVSRNGDVLPGPTFDCSPLTRFMILKIIVNNQDETEASYALGNNDGLASCDFDVAEILGYESMLPPDEEARVGGYLAAKYGIETGYPPPPAGGKSPAPAFAYKGWRNSGSLFLLTTREGADLPATACEENVPVLVRLHKDWFLFGEAQAHGEDVRFATSAGAPLAYQIDQWDAAAGTASIWVRVPEVRGNARQELKMYWGKSDAKSESSGSAVFNKANGYLSVWHMNDPVTDAAGTVTSTDLGSTPSAGMIGASRHFSGGKGIHCGDKITAYPFASSPHSAEAWLKAGKYNTVALSWAKGDGVTLRVMSTPGHLAVDSGQGGPLHATSMLEKDEWVHVVHTYDGQNERIYLNGRLDTPAAKPSTLQVLTPVRMQIGAGFVGELDEVRVSRMERSADWVKLQYENQKPLQTLVGPLVQPGRALSVNAKKLAVSEAESATVTARAGGAQKVYWIVKSGDVETIVDTDRFNYTVSGRVTGDQSYTLRFRAVYADDVKTLDIPVTIREDIPDPVFTLKAPSEWDGRETIEVVPRISNISAMQAKGAGELKTAWTVPALVEMKAVAPGKLILKRARNNGILVVTATVSNGGKPVTQTVRIAVQQPARDAWAQRAAGKDEKPVENQFYARDDKNEGTLYYNGTLTEAADSVFLKLYADDKLVKTESQKPGADGSYAFSAKLTPGLIKYKVEFGARTGDTDTVLHTVGNLVCGDAYLINGQSNALATDWGPGEHPDTSEWIRSFGDNGGDTRSGWGNAVRRQGGHWQIGCWGMDLAKLLVESRKIPICIMNGAVGGTLIEKHQRNMEDPLDKESIYGRLLNRIEQAGLTHGIRGAFWHQGECDQSNWGDAGGYGWETYEPYFLDMTAAWKHDFPNIQHYYIFQIWPNSCSIGGNRHSDKLREVQRILPRHFSNMSVMSTLGIKPEGPCHFPPSGYAELARQLLPVVEQHNYGKVPDRTVAAPDLKRACYTSDAHDEIALEFDQPMVWNDSLVSQFYPDGKEGWVTSGAVSGNIVTLKLASAADAATISYLLDRKWDSMNLLYGQNGIAALTFFEVPLESPSNTTPVR